MAIDTIAGFNPSFPELIYTNSGPFSSIEALTASNNINFRVIGNDYVLVTDPSYRNLNSNFPSITGGVFNEKYYNRSIEDKDLLLKLTTVDIQSGSSFTISLSNRNQYIKLNALSALEPESVILPELDMHPRETFEITCVENVFTLSAAPTVTVKFINPGERYFSLCLRCIDTNTYEAFGNAFNFVIPKIPPDPKLLDLDYQNTLSGVTTTNLIFLSS